MPKTIRSIARAAIIAALYALLTMILAPISYGEVQFRVSEALCILPFFFPESIVGLTIGCLIANIIGNGVFDIVLGTLATFLAAIVTYLVGRIFKNTAIRLVLGELAPCVFNGFIIPVVLIFSGVVEREAYFISAAFVFLGEAVVIGILGTGLYFALRPLMRFLQNDRSQTVEDSGKEPKKDVPIVSGTDE